MRSDLSPAISRHDYEPFGYRLHRVHLCFELDREQTRVESELEFERLGDDDIPLVLDGEALDLTHISLDGRTLAPSAFTRDAGRITLLPQARRFVLRIHNHCHPRANTSLMGLYASGEHLFTQCEAEGFRRITWFPDRPDVMAPYRVTLRADRAEFPELLSNGNPVSLRELPEGRHEAVWEDPHPKPSYLFALVAGRFDCREKTLSTRSGREVLLQVFSDTGTRDQTAWALESLERALRWDEEHYGLELDLDRFMIVAARDFNMGAMENKGLNIFNSAYVLASPDTATDASYRAIEAVIGHEYFHNWTGNRVTCRDWFQLSLKEGLTVFREQSFSADMLARGLEGEAAQSARAVKRIQDVDILRSNQFPEDAGPMAHAIRPESYRQISNFYTATIYEKGAEVIRMLHTLLGADGFRAGMDEYFRRHDGQAVTCDDFLNAMQAIIRQQDPDANLDIFRRWYGQAGTPRVEFDLEHDAAARKVRLTLRQSNPAVGMEKLLAGDAVKPPLHIPVAIGFLDGEGRTLPFDDGTDTRILPLTQAEQTWCFDDMGAKPVLSILRGFSAPVILGTPRSEAELALLARHDVDPFARWQAIQDLAGAELLRRLREHQQRPGAALAGHEAAGPVLLAIWQGLLDDPGLAPDYRHRTLQLMTPTRLMLQAPEMDPAGASVVHHGLHGALGHALQDSWHALYLAQAEVARRPFRPHPVDAGQRALRALALGYLLAGGHPQAHALAQAHYREANNLTDRLAALAALARHASEQAGSTLMADFFGRHARRDPQVMDAWFRLQATARWAGVAHMRRLMAHPEFSLRNPNRARALVFQFCLNNPEATHCPEGYDFWGEQILALDSLNPEVAARLARGLDNWARHVEPARSGMRDILLRLQAHSGLSRPVSEIVDKALSL
ncbi:MAG: aminopeptidase N [Castellaniella sp.]